METKQDPYNCLVYIDMQVYILWREYNVSLIQRCNTAS